MTDRPADNMDVYVSEVAGEAAGSLLANAEPILGQDVL